jgi:hypothetical protein
MKIEWTTTYQTNFDLEQAIEDYNLLTKYQYNVDPNKAIYDAVEANIYGVGEHQEPIEIAAKALREALRDGIQMKMDLR